MGKDGSKPLIPLEQVKTSTDSSSVEDQPYDGSKWIVSPPANTNGQNPTIVYDLSGASGDSAPQVTGISLGRDSNVKRATAIFTTPEGETEALDDLEVSPSGDIVLPDKSTPISAKKVTIVLLQPANASIDRYNVSPNIQGCFRAETTTIVTPTTTTAGTTTPSTTTVSTVSTTGTVVTTTTPTVTTTLSSTAAPSAGTTQVTTAVVTTTTTATGTTTVVCPLTNEMPKQAPDFSDKQLTPLTGGGSPTDDGSGDISWTPTYAPEKYPVLRIDLVPTGATSPPFLQSVTVSDKYATTVTVRVYSTDNTDGKPIYEITVEIVQTGTTTVYTSPDKQPVVASVVVIELGVPKNPEDPTYDTTVALVGCFQPLAGN
jgi:hypothetical protein